MFDSVIHLICHHDLLKLFDSYDQTAIAYSNIRIGNRFIVPSHTQASRIELARVWYQSTQYNLSSRSRWRRERREVGSREATRWKIEEWEIGRWFSTFDAIIHLTFRWDARWDGKAIVARYHPRLRDCVCDALLWWFHSGMPDVDILELRSIRIEISFNLISGERRKGEREKRRCHEKKVRTHVDITSDFRRLSGICTTTSVQIDVLAKCNWLRNSTQFR